MSGAARSLKEEAALKVRPTKLTATQRSLIWGMVVRGDRLQDIAYWFGVSPSTVHAIKKANAKQSWTLNDASTAELPPPGPYQLVRRIEYARLVDVEGRNRAIVSELELLLSKYRNAAVSGASQTHIHS